MRSLLLVMAGGALGSGARYLTQRGMLLLGPFPYGTLTVNLVGGLLMGVLTGSLIRFGDAQESARLLLGVGILGGFTTFSSFSLDAVTLWQRGAGIAASGYVLASVVGAIAALGVGLALARQWS